MSLKQSAPALGHEHILLVEDEPPIVRVVSQIFQKLGYTVTGFIDSAAALNHFKLNSDDYDIIITDLTMPKMIGDILAMELQKIKPQIPIVFCTGYNQKISQDRAAVIGFKAVVKKPILKADLTATVRKVLDEAAALEADTPVTS